MDPCQQQGVISYSTELASSFAHWVKRPLAQGQTPEILAQNLYHAPFIVVSHGIEPDPIFCYANLAAQKLWNIGWDDFIRMPSRLSAEPVARAERESLLQAAQTNGYVDDYQGVRITSDGKRFKITRCILWNVLDSSQKKIGQAATFDQWEWI